jgi:hypothetical protein
MCATSTSHGTGLVQFQSVNSNKYVYIMIYIYNYIERESRNMLHKWLPMVSGGLSKFVQSNNRSNGDLVHRNLFAQNCSNPCAAGWTHLQYTQILPACNLLSCSFQRPFILCTQLSFQETFNLFCTFCRCFRSSEKKTLYKHFVDDG